MNSYRPYLDILKALDRKIQPGLRRDYQLVCTTGEILDSACLKLQKKSWTRNGAGEGVFFSVWLGEKELKESRFHYNIHALKLRLWPDHQIKPVTFAAGFRKKFAPQKRNWPNLSLEFGPHTLMQGWVHLHPETFAKEVLELVRRFVAMHQMIDGLLEKEKKIPAKTPRKSSPRSSPK